MKLTRRVKSLRGKGFAVASAHNLTINDRMCAIIKQLHNIPKQEQHTGQTQSTQSTIQSAHTQLQYHIPEHKTAPPSTNKYCSIPPSQQNATQRRLTHQYRRSISLTQAPVQPTRTKHLQSQHLNLNQNTATSKSNTTS